MAGGKTQDRKEREEKDKQKESEKEKENQKQNEKEKDKEKEEKAKEKEKQKVKDRLGDKEREKATEKEKSKEKAKEKAKDIGSDKPSSNALPGYIFGCTNVTKQECYDRGLFGSTSTHCREVERIDKGTRLFLFNFDDRVMHGVYVARGKGGCALVRDAWEGRFPWQVRFEVEEEFPALKESEFKSAIRDNVYKHHKYSFTLTDQQVSNLIALFRRNSIPQQLGVGDGEKVSKEETAGVEGEECGQAGEGKDEGKVNREVEGVTGGMEEEHVEAEVGGKEGGARGKEEETRIGESRSEKVVESLSWCSPLRFDTLMCVVPFSPFDFLQFLFPSYK
ncbi:unnamed protein product [Closterium sp. Yama58-4]|nr:unnamed protein product [Closterium sp. Yama58-4]